MSVTHSRVENALRSVLGSDVATILSEPNVTDLMLNEDGTLWVDRTGQGMTNSGKTLSPEKAEAALRMLSSLCGGSLTRDRPFLSATIPTSGERVAGTIQPVTDRPTFAIRKPSSVIFPLEAFFDDREDDVDEEEQVDLDGMSIRQKVEYAIRKKMNILVSGSTGSGKSSLLTTLINLPSVAADRLLVAEDTRELNLSHVPNHVRMLTTEEVGFRDLVKIFLRYRGDRILIGELRDGHTAMEWINACNTGHEGSFATIHANSAFDSQGRLEDLCNQVTTQPPLRAIKNAIGCLIWVRRTKTGRAIREVVFT